MCTFSLQYCVERSCKTQQTRDGKKIPYAYRTFAENYGKYAKKHKATMPIRRKPGKVLGAALSRLTTKDTYWR